MQPKLIAVSVNEQGQRVYVYRMPDGSRVDLYKPYSAADEGVARALAAQSPSASRGASSSAEVSFAGGGIRRGFSAMPMPVLPLVAPPIRRQKPAVLAMTQPGVTFLSADIEASETAAEAVSHADLRGVTIVKGLFGRQI